MSKFFSVLQYIHVFILQITFIGFAEEMGTAHLQVQYVSIYIGK